MKDKSKYESLIFKFLSHEISDEELIDLETWARKGKNLKIVEDYIKLNYFTNLGIHDFDALKAYNKSSLRKTKPATIKKIIPKFLRYAAAAILIGVLATVYFFRDNSFSDQPDAMPIIVNNNIEVGTDKATLTLEDGSIVALEKGQEYIANNLISTGEEIIYNSQPTTKPEIAYNTLTIPRGGQFQITLADGTQVWLNSETQLKYPVVFTEGVTRKVELVYGEAYFDVSPSTEHQGANFKVIHDAQEVQVIGTEFNIKAYKDETNIYTTLVEGEVAVDYNNESKILTPNQQSNLDLNLNSLKVSSVDVYDEVAWKDGVFSFKNKPLKDIAKVLSRWYDVDIVFLDNDLKKVRFNGVLGRDQSIEEILAAIKSVSINNYQINDKTIIIK